MDFEWDERKAAANLRKHGVSFDLAIAVFADPNRVEGFSRRKDREDRFYVIGRTPAFPDVLFVVYAWRHYEHENKTNRRIISARAAGREERRRYSAVR